MLSVAARERGTAFSPTFHSSGASDRFTGRCAGCMAARLLAFSRDVLRAPLHRKGAPDFTSFRQLHYFVDLSAEAQPYSSDIANLQNVLLLPGVIRPKVLNGAARAARSCHER